jgi:hypothetical protein
VSLDPMLDSDLFAPHPGRTGASRILLADASIHTMR